MKLITDEFEVMHMEQREAGRINIHSDGFWINYMPSGRNIGIIMHSSVKNISSAADTMQVWHITGRKTEEQNRINLY